MCEGEQTEEEVLPRVGFPLLGPFLGFHQPRDLPGERKQEPGAGVVGRQGEVLSPTLHPSEFPKGPVMNEFIKQTLIQKWTPGRQEQLPRLLWPQLASTGPSEVDGSLWGLAQTLPMIDVPVHPQCRHSQLAPGKGDPEAVLEAGVGTGQPGVQKEGLLLALHPFTGPEEGN